MAEDIASLIWFTALGFGARLLRPVFAIGVPSSVESLVFNGG